MEVTLKRALDLVRASTDAANKVKAVAVAPISIHTANVDAAIEEAARKFETSAREASALIAARFAIREAVGAANAREGIDELMTRRELLDAQEKRLTQLIDACSDDEGEVTTAETAAARVKATKDRFATADRFGATEFVRVRVVAAEQIEAMKAQRAELRRERGDVADRIAGLNLNTRIRLNEATVQALKRAKII